MCSLPSLSAAAAAAAASPGSELGNSAEGTGSPGRPRWETLRGKQSKRAGLAAPPPPPPAAANHRGRPRADWAAPPPAPPSGSSGALRRRAGPAPAPPPAAGPFPRPGAGGGFLHTLLPRADAPGLTQKKARSSAPRAGPRPPLLPTAGPAQRCSPRTAPGALPTRPVVAPRPSPALPSARAHRTGCAGRRAGRRRRGRAGRAGGRRPPNGRSRPP